MLRGRSRSTTLASCGAAPPATDRRMLDGSAATDPSLTVSRSPRAPGPISGPGVPARTPGRGAILRGVTRPTLTGTPDAVPTVELDELLEERRSRAASTDGSGQADVVADRGGAVAASARAARGAVPAARQGPGARGLRAPRPVAPAGAARGPARDERPPAVRGDGPRRPGAADRGDAGQGRAPAARRALAERAAPDLDPARLSRRTRPAASCRRRWRACAPG